MRWRGNCRCGCVQSEYQDGHCEERVSGDSGIEQSRAGPVDLARVVVGSANMVLSAVEGRSYDGEMSDAGRPALRVINGGLSAAPGPDPGPVHTIVDVAKACGLPQPAIAQVVPRTWTDDGWMYTDAQLQEAVAVAETMRSRPDGDGG